MIFKMVKHYVAPSVDCQLRLLEDCWIRPPDPHVSPDFHTDPRSFLPHREPYLSKYQIT